MECAKFCTLMTERLILRKFREADTETLFSYRTDPRVALYQGGELANFTLEQFEEFINEQMNFEPGIPDTWFQIAVELKEGGSLIGDLAIHTLPQGSNQFEMGFTIKPEYQGKGFGIEAVKCLLEYLFKGLGAHRIIAVADVRNTASVKLLEKAGMRKEGEINENGCTYAEFFREN
ncbi:MAG: GNAT family N-acetyltransferase [Clostridiales bacterium]|nr:GNAT family N-acetyltransferase [Clostridiales bacterium]